VLADIEDPWGQVFYGGDPPRDASHLIVTPCPASPLPVWQLSSWLLSTQLGMGAEQTCLPVVTEISIAARMPILLGAL